MPVAPPLDRLLAEGILRLGLSLPDDEAIPRLEAYLRLLHHWNRVYNLTAVRDLGDMVSKHVLDSLSIAPWITDRVVDVGSGAGLPGIPLAIALPNTAFVLLESQRKRTRFLQQAVAELGLQNVEIVGARAQNYAPKRPFSQIISRAFASLHAMISATAHLVCEDGGEFLAMKGALPTEELAQCPIDPSAITVHKLCVPGLTTPRHLIQIKATQNPTDGAAVDHAVRNSL